ncbi:esterase-like activity of phytase-domain-containing protein [Mrakia frigida]|uniref:esterase-like activity of phytase family protein n=1 Tax=Mrakia frigida TaxID=29902 RepID=UPI003FCC25C3
MVHLSLSTLLFVLPAITTIVLASPARLDVDHQAQLSNAERFSQGLKTPAKPAKKFLEKKKKRAAHGSRTQTAKRATTSGVTIPVGTTTLFGGQAYVNKGLVGFGTLAADAKDSLGETIGGLGSAMEFVPGSWARSGTSNLYTGTLITQPDRGHNTDTTTDYVVRQQYLDITLTPNYDTATQTFEQGRKSVSMTYSKSLLYSDAAGVPVSGLDALGVRAATADSPALPIASATYDHLSLDAEGLVVNADGTFYVSDEYGPYIYHFSATGSLLSTIAPPAAVLPMKDGALSFTSDAFPDTGRAPNQGFEGLTASPDGSKLWAVAQSGMVQDGGADQDNKYTRIFGWDLTTSAPTLVEEYVFLLPVTNGKSKALATSDFRWLNSDSTSTTFILLSRDGKGMGNDDSESKHKDFLLISTAGATNIANTVYSTTVTPVAPGGVLVPGVTAITPTDFIDIIDDSELARFGLQNGGAFDETLISGKWESSALASCLDPLYPNDYFLLSLSDNDFITSNGFEAGAVYSDAYGKEVNTQILVWRITLPNNPGTIA